MAIVIIMIIIIIKNLVFHYNFLIANSKNNSKNKE